LSEDDPEGPIRCRESHPRLVALRDQQLLAEGDILKQQRPTGAHRAGETLEEHDDKTQHSHEC
jgi:hypothetical protein